jgi:hypothetical protein
MKAYFTVFAVVSLQLFLVGCSNTPSLTKPVAKSLTPQNMKLGGANLQGKWAQACDAQDPSVGTTSTDGTLSFTGNNVSADFTLYSDSNCKTPTAKEHQQGTYVLGNPPDATNGAPAIDYNVTQVTVTYFDQKTIDGLVKNAGDDADCDLTKFDFKVGVAEDISSQDGCLHQEGIGQERYSVIKIIGNQLFMGTTANGSGAGDSQDARSTKLSADFLTKQ